MESTQYGVAMSWKQYVERHVTDRKQSALAKLVEVDAGTVSRWLKGTQGVDAGVAIRFARAVEDEPLNALLAAEFITPEEARATVTQQPDYSQLTNDQLLDLVRARMKKEVVGNVEHPAPKTQAGDVPAFRDSKANGLAEASSDEVVEAPTQSHEDDEPE